MSDLKRYSLIWQKCSDNGKLAERFYVPGFEGNLPFFLNGHKLKAFEKGEKTELKEKELLQGILFGLYEFKNDPKPWHKTEDKSTYLYLLDILGNGFGFNDPEQMILDVAATMRHENGSIVSRKALKTGLDLIPFSSKIRSDLVCDTWVVISENGSDEQSLREIIDLISEIHLESLLPDAKEIICYYGLCAKVLSKKSTDDIESYLQEFIYPNVKLTSLKIKIRDLLLNPDTARAKDLQVT